MWIRTQDNSLINLQNVKKIAIDKSIIGIDGGIIAGYTTKERALEILDEIQEHIETRIVADNLLLNAYQYNIDKYGEEIAVKKMRELSCVYVMPKE